MAWSAFGPDRSPRAAVLGGTNGYQPERLRHAVATVRLDGMLRQYVRVQTVDSGASSVRGVIQDLEGRYPRLTGKLRDETGAIRKFVRVFVNGEDVAGLNGLETAVSAADRVEILHSIAGG